MKIAIIGSGIAGNVVAHHLYRHYDITVFESNQHIGGHTHTHSIEWDGESHEIDTGFIVFNNWTYPNFIALLRKLSVDTRPSTMSFSVRNETTGLEYNGTSLNGLFAQRRNIFRPFFLRILKEIVRFNRDAPKLLASKLEISLGEYLVAENYGQEFIRNYLIPMAAAIWSARPSQILAVPAHFFVRFFHNHGMLSVDNRPEWRVIAGGSMRYVESLVRPFKDRIRLNTPVESVQRGCNGVVIRARGCDAERYDHVFLACHSDQALKLLADATPVEHQILGAIRYQENEVVLHTDISVLPRNRRAWAAWNYHVLAERQSEKEGADAGVRATLTYNMNILQNLKSRSTYCVTLNGYDNILAERILKQFTYSHPIYTAAAIAAQLRHHEINSGNRTSFCGAYWGYGFHEDGVLSAIKALEHFRQAQQCDAALLNVA